MSDPEQISLFDLDPTLEPQKPQKSEKSKPAEAAIAPESKVNEAIYANLDELKAEAIACQKCPLAETRINVVVERGNREAKIMIIGEGPGQNEDEQGLPFVGKAGQLLDKILASVQLGEQDVYVANIVKCLSGYTRIYTKEGAKLLHWIVKHQWAGEVLSVDVDGHLAWKKVVGWHRSRLAGRSLYKVSFKDGKANSNGEVGYTATGDHPVLTQRGWVTVENLQDDDLVATGTPAPGSRGLQVLLGSLLGDGCIDWDGQFHEGHSIKQKTYLGLKAKVLSGFKPKLREMLMKLSNGKDYPSVGLELAKTYYLHDLRQEWYPKNKKDFPVSALEKLDRFGLAIWYMDDGYWRRKIKNGKTRQAIDVEIALGNISPETADRVVEYFESQGYRTYKTFRSTWRLCFRYNEGIRFLENIAEYCPQSMRYKIPEELHHIAFNLGAYQEEAVVTYWKPVVKKLLPSKTDSHLMYCIDVEDTANFVTPAGVVHNCRPPGNRVPTDEEVAACKPYLLEQIRLVDPKIILLTGATAVKAITGDKTGITKIRGKWMEWEGRLVMPILHPAYLLRNASREEGSPKWLMWQDIQAVKAKYLEFIAASPSIEEEEF